MLLARSDRVFTPRLSWAKAGTGELSNYASMLSRTLQATHPPVDALLCTDRCCKDSNHHGEIAHYAEAITRACVSAAESSIPYVILRLVVYRGGANKLGRFVRNHYYGIEYGSIVGVRGMV